MGNRVALVALALTLAVAGCGGSDSETDTADSRAAEIAAEKQHDLKLKLEREKAKKARAAKAAARAKAASSALNSEIDSMLSSLPGQSGLVVGAPGGDGLTLSGGDLTSLDAWSTFKVPISERVLVDAGGPDALTETQRNNINAALTLSDNAAAAALFDDLEATHGGLQGASDAVGEMLRQAGDDETVISTVGRDSFTTYGQTDWSLSEQNKYMASLAGGCIPRPGPNSSVNRASRKYLFDQMSQVTSDTWGFGSAGVPAKWKGGWGPGTDGKYLVRQMGTMQIGGEEAVVTLAAIADDGSFESGQAMASEIASWAATNLKGKIPEPAPC